MLAALVAVALLAPGRADELADFHAAVEHAEAEYRRLMTTLETRGQEETAAAVHRFRDSWQAINDRFGKNRPATLADDEEYGTMFMLVDARLVGVLIVIDMGNRDAARAALAPIREKLAQLSARSAPAPK